MDWLRQGVQVSRTAPKRVANAVSVRLRTIAMELRYRLAVRLLGYRPMALDPRIDNSVSRVCVREQNGTRTVVKFPRFGIWWARRFYNDLKVPDGLSGIRVLLASLASDPVMGTHVPRVHHVDRLGVIESEYVDGENLAVLKAYILEHLTPPPGVRPAAVRRALQQLRADLRSYWAQGGARRGDWDLQNLIYETSSGVIKNVDHEGFVTYRDGDPQTSDEFIELLLGGMDAVLELVESDSAVDQRTLAALSAVWKTTHSGESYSGRRYLAGYHSLRIAGKSFRGQRDCEARLATVPFDFADKVVLDLGCNAGGMLHALAGVIGEGVGIDRDPRCVNAATLVAQVNGTSNLHFLMFDLEHDELDDLRVFTFGQRIDICFMLSVAMWIPNWKEVVRFASTFADAMLFETNGSSAQQGEQVAHLRQCFSDVRVLQDRSPDDPLQKNRAMYLCSGPRP
jgi:hypothetical protein